MEDNQLAKTEFKAPETLTPEEVSKVLDVADATIKWLKSVQDYAKSQIEAGKGVPGYKVVDGRFYRDWSSEDDVKKMLDDMGYSEEEYMEAELMSPAEIEKQFGKSVYAQLEGRGLVTKTPGRPTLTCIDDPRKASGADSDYSFLFDKKGAN